MPSLFIVQQGIDEALQDTVVEAFFSGLYTALLLVTIAGFCTKRTGRKVDIWMICLTVTLYIVSTMHFGYHWYLSRHAFVRNDENPQSIFVAFYQLPFWGRVLGSFVFAFNTLLADCLFIWRCWVIWDCDWRIIALPVLTTLVGTVFSGLNLAVQDNNSTFTISGRFVDTGTPYLALSLTTTVYVTIAISYRIWSLSYNPKDDGESRFTYTNVIAIVVESALLYSIALLIMVVLIIRKNPIYRYLQDIVAQIVGISPTLIIARISFGFSEPHNSWSQSRAIVSDMVFASSVLPPNSSLTLRTGQEDAPMKSDLDHGELPPSPYLRTDNGI